MKTNYRRTLLFILVNTVVLIQILVTYLFYKDYLQSKELDSISDKITQSNRIKNLTNSSRTEILNAQDWLRKYILKPDPKSLEQYFVSLQRVQKNLKEIDQFAPLHPKIQDLLKNQSKAIPRLDQLKVLVDSTQSISQLPEKKTFNTSNKTL